jgi:hypothetical protein
MKRRWKVFINKKTYAIMLLDLRKRFFIYWRDASITICDDLSIDNNFEDILFYMRRDKIIYSSFNPQNLRDDLQRIPYPCEIILNKVLKKNGVRI